MIHTRFNETPPPVWGKLALSVIGKTCIILPQFGLLKEFSMQKTELIAHVAKESGVSQAEAAKIINKAIDVIVATLKAGEKVTLTGFGTFEVRKTAARTGTNPRTRQKIQIAASKRATFSAGTQLREAVSGKSK
jgi:DNA-binding protein HU-beta